jgi:anthranilate phosphoribosyltransferase
MSSRCGSADVLEALGIRIDISPEKVAACIDQVGFGFMFAALLHPAMKYVMPVRKALGFRTIFNVLGPLTNPAGARRQVMGVFDPAWCRPLAQVLIELGAEHVLVVHSEGIDELSCGGENILAEGKGQVEEKKLTPEDLGLTRTDRTALQGGDASQNATIIKSILAGEKGPCQEVALLNAAAAIYVGGKAPDLKSGLQVAAAAIASGKAQQVLQRLQEATNS